MKKGKIYLDMSKLNREQQDEVLSLIEAKKDDVTFLIKDEYVYLHYCDADNYWFVDESLFIKNKEEISFDGFKKLLNE